MLLRPVTRILVIGGLATAMTLAGASAASAHVTINPGSAEAGSYAVITVKVPNESATAATAKVAVQLPTGTPFSSVRYVPVPGWATELVRTTLPEPVKVGDNEITEAVTSVVWTAATGSEIGDGQLQQFDLSVGPVPDTGSISLPTVQTYTDGEVVEWTGTTAGSEHPAPVLYVNDAVPGDEHGGAERDASDGAASPGDSSPASVTSSDDLLARVLGIGGLVLGAVGVVLAVTSRREAKS